MTLDKKIYSSIFPKDYGPIWQQFAIENSGIYSPIPNNRVQFDYNNFKITFDTYTHYTVVGGTSYESEFTRGIVSFSCPNHFKILITQQGFFENIGKLFGVQDLQIGEKQFDKKFMIKSNDEAKAILILSSNTITKLLEELSIVRFEITDGEGLWNEKPEEGECMLYVVLDNKITHISNLNKLSRLCKETLNSLTTIIGVQPIKTSSK